MVRKPLLAMVAMASLVGCSTVPATTMASKVVPGRSVMSVQSKVQPPTLAVMREILPRRLSVQAARTVMVIPAQNQVRVPNQGMQPNQGNAPNQGINRPANPNMEHPSRPGVIPGVTRGITQPVSQINRIPTGQLGLYPFSYLGSNWYAPYYMTGNYWYPYSLGAYDLGAYSYLDYPFTYSSVLGCYSPYIYGLGAYGYPYGSLGYYPSAWPYSYSSYGWGWPSWVI